MKKFKLIRVRDGKSHWTNWLTFDEYQELKTEIEETDHFRGIAYRELVEWDKGREND